jgi:co-chaperonin GroES (HSP10)
VRRFKKTERSKGGIVLPDSSRDVSQFGQVVDFGEMVTDIQRGDFVLFSGYAAPCVATNDSGDDLVFLKQQDLFATVETDAVPAVNGHEPQGAAASGKGEHS